MTNATLRGLAAAVLTASSQLAGASDALEARIAALEAQLDALKAAVASQAEVTGDGLQTISVRQDALEDELEEVRPMKAGTRFRYGGYVQLDAIASEYSDGKPASLMDDIFVPSLIPVESADGENDSYRSTNIHAKTSRFYFHTDTDTDAGRVSSHIELDFVLSGQGDERVSNSFSSRIRHAFVNWDYAPGRSLMAGQNWSTFFNVAVLPDLIDFVGPVGTVFERQPQLRWTAGGLQLAVENALTRLNEASGATRIDDGEDIPDFVARYNGRSGDLLWSASAILRQLDYEARDGEVERSSDSVLGYGASLAGKWLLGEDDLRFMASYGDALGRYMGLNAFNDGYVKDNGDIGTIDQWGAVLAYRHFWAPEWRSTFSVSASGASNPSAAEFAGAAGLAKAYRSMHVNLNYLPAPGLQLGGEFMWGSKELEDGRDGDMARLQFAVKYAF